MKSIAEKDFADSCLAVLSGASGGSVVVMKNGRPVARLTSIMGDEKLPTGGEVVREYLAKTSPKGIGHLHGLLKGKIAIKGDILSTGVKWDAESGHEYPALQPQRRVAARRTAKRKRK